MDEKGTLSIQTEDIFPIIKQFLYSDQEVFLRELVSNAVDATKKLEVLANSGRYKGDLGDLRIEVALNTSAKTLTIRDKGVGMSAEEVKRYINQIAFSGAKEFISRHKKASTEGIIGHFGLGFYSAFMVADKVELHTRSYQEDQAAVCWSCSGSTEFSISKTFKKTRGTDVVLYLSESAHAFADKARIQGLLKKYGRFLPIPVLFDNEVINEPAPAWTKPPNSLKDQDYLDFYKLLYPYAETPLFWIHLNVDYPFHLTGLLYFPHIRPSVEPERNQIQLYAKQVFITDEVQDIVPDFLRLLHGVIDSPDIPLNVSRSALQVDPNVRKINTHITKKVADKLSELFQDDRQAFEKKWESIGLFVKYGMLSEEKFYEQVKEFALVRNTKGVYFTLSEYETHVKEAQSDHKKEIIWLYTTDTEAQHGALTAATQANFDVLQMDGLVDTHFINFMDAKQKGITWKRVDSDVLAHLIRKGKEAPSVLRKEEEEVVQNQFKAVAGEGALVRVLPQGASAAPVQLTRPEAVSRMADMARLQGQAPMDVLKGSFTLTLNADHPIIKHLAKHKDETLVTQCYQLARLAQHELRGEALSEYVTGAWARLVPTPASKPKTGQTPKPKRKGLEANKT